MAGTDKSQTLMADGPAVILVRPQMGENIGAAARAMMNFGLTDLRLVAPRDGWPNDKARAMASRADSVLDNAQLFERTEDAIADLNVVFATTARRRDMVKPVLTPRRAVVDLAAAAGQGQQIGLMFGGERAGLDNEDVVLCDAVITVPANPGFSSINLAQAVLLLGYEWFALASDVPEVDPADGGNRPANKQELVDLFEHLEAELDDSGYFANVAAKRPAMVRNIRNIFQRGQLLEQDVRTLRGVIKALAGRRGQRSRPSG